MFGIQHLLFDRLQALGFSVYCTTHADFPLVVLHAAYVVLQTAIEIFLALQLRRSAVEAADLSLIVEHVDRGGRVCLSIDDIPVRASTAVVLKVSIAKIEAAMSAVSASTSHVERAAREIASGSADQPRRWNSLRAPYVRTRTTRSRRVRSPPRPRASHSVAAR